MPIHHRRRAVEWFLLLHETTIDHAHKHAHIPQPAPPTSANDEPIGPALYDTGLNPEEGLWTRSGWAGHS